MSSSKFLLTVSGVAALICIGAIFYQQHLLQEARARADALQVRQEKLQAQVTEFNSKLLAEAAAAKAAAASPGGGENLADRMKKGRELAAAGRHEEALKEFLWCYDVGMQRIDRALLAQRIEGELSSAITELGKVYPPAMEALKERKDKAAR